MPPGNATRQGPLAPLGDGASRILKVIAKLIDMGRVRS
jgi:hypothetical protein